MLNILLFITVHLFGKESLQGNRNHMTTSNSQTEKKKKGSAPLIHGVSTVWGAQNDHISRIITFPRLSIHRLTHSLSHIQYSHKQHACITETIHMQHTYAQHTQTCIFIYTINHHNLHIHGKQQVFKNYYLKE